MGTEPSEPRRSRTFDQQIKSLLLCQLSYGPNTLSRQGAITVFSLCQGALGTDGGIRAAGDKLPGEGAARGCPANSIRTEMLRPRGQDDILPR